MSYRYSFPFVIPQLFSFVIPRDDEVEIVQLVIPQDDEVEIGISCEAGTSLIPYSRYARCRIALELTGYSYIH